MIAPEMRQEGYSEEQIALYVGTGPAGAGQGMRAANGDTEGSLHYGNLDDRTSTG
jgi:hypothetical protein